MRLSHSPRRVSILLLAVFGLLIVVSTVVAVRFMRNVSLVKETDNLRDDLQVIAQEIAENLDDGQPEDKAFNFLEVTARIQRQEHNFSFVLRDASGTIVSPSFLRDRELRMEDRHYVARDSSTFVATVWGQHCFVIVYPFPDRSMELLGVYKDLYVFEDVDDSVTAFIVLMSFVFFVLLLASWLWIIPAIERMYERRNRAEDELHLAHDLQQKAVTQVFPQDPRCRVHAVLQAMKDVGGDLYVCEQNGGKLYFAVGDVSDKGTAAAFVMFLVSSVISSCFKHGMPLVRIMETVNLVLLDNEKYEMFCTLLLGCIDLETRGMEYVNAGHTKAILDGAFLDQDPQLIVGVKSGFPYHSQHVQLRPGSRLLAYTDGVTEARAEDRSFFGAARLLAWMQAQPASASPEEICAGLIDTLSSFRGAARQNDDIAILCIETDIDKI